MSEEHVLNQLVQVLDRLLIPNAQISENNVNKLVKCITGMPDELINKSSLNGILQIWFLQAVNIWENNLPHPAILTLALNFAVFLSSQEECFVELNDNRVIERFIRILNMTLQNMGATPDVGYVKFLDCFLNHNTGCEWMLSRYHWFEILSLTRPSDQSTHLDNEKAKFICKLLLKSFDIKPAIPSEIIHSLLLPTIDFSESLKTDNNTNETAFILNCLSNLYLLRNIIELLLDGIDQNNKEKTFELFKIIFETSEKYTFQDRGIDICRQLSNDDIAYKLITILYNLNFLDILCRIKDTSLVVYQDILPRLAKGDAIRRNLQTNFQKFFPRIVFNWIKISSKCHLFLPKIKLTTGSVVSLEDTLTYCQLAPIFMVSCHFSRRSTYDFENNELRENFMFSRLKAVMPAACYQLYQIKNYMADHFSFDFSIMGIEYLLKSTVYYGRRQANNALACLIYCLEDFTEILIKNNLVTCPEAMKYLAGLLKVIKVFINEFNLKWPDNFETITLMEIILSILTTPSLNSHVIVNVLELTSVAFSKHLTVSLAILIDCSDADVTDKIIAICIEKMKEEKSQVKCSAIKVIESIATIVNKNFTSFQRLIEENNLPVKIFECVINDKDPYVRASAVKCLQEMTKVGAFWSSIMESYDIYEHLCQILYKDSSDVVRGELATLIAFIFEQHDLPNETMMKLYESMVYSITEEKNPTIRKKSLQFWENVIHRHLTTEGMIDGTFPEFTFSKESRKIVSLDNCEIKKRLIKVLHKLSGIGCLSALKTALQDFDTEVHNDAKDIVKILYDLLKTYDVQSYDLDFSPRRSFSEADIIGIPMKQDILSPDLFFNVIQEYFKPITVKPDISQKYHLEIILSQILNESPGESNDFDYGSIDEVWQIYDLIS